MFTIKFLNAATSDDKVSKTNKNNKSSLHTHDVKEATKQKHNKTDWLVDLPIGTKTKTLWTNKTLVGK